MRDPKRIGRIAELFEALWHTMPDMRFGQMLHYMSYYAKITMNADPFNMEDPAWETLLRTRLQQKH